MNIKPVASPSAIQQAPSTAADTKARAIAAFNAANQPQQPIVQNQNQVSPEEMSAIAPPVQEEVRQEDTEVSPEVAPVVTEEPQQDPALSRQFAQLARQEKAMRAKAQQQEQTFKAREQALQAREQELAAKDQTYKSGYISRDTLKQDTLTALAEAGVSYEELTQQIISQQPIDPRLQNTITQLKAQIEELKADREASKASQVEQQTQAYQAAVKQIKTDATKLVNSDTNFETIKATNSINDVVDLIEQTYKKDGYLMTVEEAAQAVEDYLVEEGLKIAKIEKIKRKLQEASTPQTASRPAQTQAAQPKQPQPMKTLTNATSSTRQLSAKERAILAFNGQLKS